MPSLTSSTTARFDARVSQQIRVHSTSNCPLDSHTVWRSDSMMMSGPLFFFFPLAVCVLVCALTGSD